MTDLAAELQTIRQAGLERRRRVIESAQGPRITLDGHEVVLLCSNDYLGLASHPALAEAAADAAARWGTGAGASPLVSGHMTPHRQLEEELAAFKGCEACVLFGSGFLANTGVIAALAGRGDVILSDALNHASIVDGCRLSRAETIVYAHNDLDALERGLQQAGERDALIVTDAVFSMDGDVAPLAGIADLSQRYGARVVVDEAHATGVLGPGGRGLVAELGLEVQVNVVTGTLGKALGSYGAFACCNAATAQFLVNRARSLIFSTALPPTVVASALAALELLVADPGLVTRLGANAQLMRTELAAAGLAVSAGTMPIIPLLVGAPEAAVAMSAAALERGVFAQAIRPPTVPDGTSRLRLAVSAAHTQDDLRRAAHVLSETLSDAQTAASRGA